MKKKNHFKKNFTVYEFQQSPDRIQSQNKLPASTNPSVTNTFWCKLIQLCYKVTVITVVCSLQKSCIDFTIQARPLERYMPKERNSFKYKIWRIVVSTPFEYFIMILIVCNTLLLMMKVCILLG